MNLNLNVTVIFFHDRWLWSIATKTNSCVVRGRASAREEAERAAADAARKLVLDTMPKETITHSAGAAA